MKAAIRCRMDQKQVIVLDFLSDDHFAFWDFADSFPNFRPDASKSVVEGLIELVQQGYVAVAFGDWSENETRPVTADGAEAALRDPASWQPTGKEPGYILELTDRGAQLLREQGIGRS